MHLGLVTPIVTRHPQNDAAWTEDAGPAELVRIVYDGPALAGKTTSLKALASSLGRTTFSGDEAQGRTLADVSIVVAGRNLSSGQPIDITGLRLKGADGSDFLLPFAALITGDPGVTATPATLGGQEVQLVTGSGEGSVPITGYVDDDLVLLIRTADEVARDEVLAALTQGD